MNEVAGLRVNHSQCKVATQAKHAETWFAAWRPYDLELHWALGPLAPGPVGKLPGDSL